MMKLNLTELNNTLIICPNSYKNKLLEYFNNEKKLFDVNFITIEEYTKKYFFDYDVRAIKYITDKNISQENAKEILDNLYYVDNKQYDNLKLDKLVQYKNELDRNNLLIYNKLFKEYLKTKNVIVYGYGKINNFYKNIIKGKTVKIIEDEHINKEYIINEFEEIEQEVEYIYNSIFDLLEKDIDINNIHILNATDEYEPYFKRYNSYYGFNVDYTNNEYIVGTSIAKQFIEMLDNSSKQEIYQYLKEQNNTLASKLINLLNKYVGYEISDIKNLIIEDLKNITISKNYKDVVKCDSLFTKFDDKDYVFLIGFNDETPSLNKDTNYITDNIKSLVNLTTTEEENELKKENFKAYISNINNLFISYSKNNPFKTHNKQFNFDDGECNYNHINGNFYYSEKLNRYKYTDKLDRLRKFNDVTEDVDKLYKTYDKNNYLSYKNEFNGLSKQQINTITKTINNNDKLILSYSSMNNFYECNFKYYLDSVLKINEPFGTYYTKLGTVCHGVLEDLYKEKDFDFDCSWNRQIDIEEKKENKKIFDDESEQFFVLKIKEELRNDIEIVRQQKENSEFSNQKCENNFSYDVNEKIKFIGYIDKVMYKETDDEILASVVDYKTSKAIEIDKDIMKFGLSLQLPSYLFLMKCAENFNKNVKFAGFYIQHILNFDNKYKQDSSLSDIKKESMKLDGISSIETERLMALDLSLVGGQKSENIKGISVNKDGSLRKSNKLYSDKQFEELIDLVETNIVNAGNTILSGDFSINPKEIDGENKSCRYCKYSPICYKRAKDLKYLSTKEEQ